MIGIDIKEILQSGIKAGRILMITIRQGEVRGTSLTLGITDRFRIDIGGIATSRFNQEFYSRILS